MGIWQNAAGSMLLAVSDTVARHCTVASSASTQPAIAHEIICAPTTFGDFQEVLDVRVLTQASILSVEVVPYVFRSGRLLTTHEVPAFAYQHARQLLVALRNSTEPYGGPAYK